MNEVLVPKLKEIAKCRKCMSCVNACPVKAISYEDDIFQVNKELCSEHIKKKFDQECFTCLMACRTNALVLEVYEKND
ncbi:MAG: 4Fe-4S binding protein [Candidatus Helarchaeota archaeon]